MSNGGFMRREGPSIKKKPITVKRRRWVLDIELEI
jgi:hypothetical protein